MRLRPAFQEKIYKDYSAGKKYTETKLYRYSIQYNPISAIHTWIVRQKKIEGAPREMQDSIPWEWVQPLDYPSIQ